MSASVDLVVAAMEAISNSASATAEALRNEASWNYDSLEVTSLGITAKAFEGFAAAVDLHVNAVKESA